MLKEKRETTTGVPGVMLNEVKTLRHRDQQGLQMNLKEEVLNRHPTSAGVPGVMLGEAQILRHRDQQGLQTNLKEEVLNNTPKKNCQGRDNGQGLRIVNE